MSIIEQGYFAATRIQEKVREQFDPMRSDRALRRMVRAGRTPVVAPLGEQPQVADWKHVVSTPPRGCSWHSPYNTSNPDTGELLFRHRRTGELAPADTVVVDHVAARELQFRIDIAKHRVAAEEDYMDSDRSI